MTARVRTSASRADLERGRDNVAWLREEQEAIQQQAIWSSQMPKPETSPIGVKRRTVAATNDAFGSINCKLDEAVDKLRDTFAREAQMERVDTAQREDDSRRAPVLKNRRAR